MGVLCGNEQLFDVKFLTHLTRISFTCFFLSLPPVGLAVVFLLLFTHALPVHLLQLILRIIL